MPSDQTLSKLKLRTPLTSRGALQAAMIGTIQSGALSGPAAKVATAAKFTARVVKAKSPIPKTQSEALARLIETLGKRGVPLTKKAVEITDDGRFSIEFIITIRALPAEAIHPLGFKRIRDTFADEVRKTSIWRQPSPGDYKLVTTQSFDFLKNLGDPSEDYLLRYDINKTTASPMELRLAAATERAEEKGLI